MLSLLKLNLCTGVFQRLFILRKHRILPTFPEWRITVLPRAPFLTTLYLVSSSIHLLQLLDLKKWLVPYVDSYKWYNISVTIAHT